MNLAGWLDPICFFFRSLATSIYPAFQDAVTRVFSWIYDADPGIGPVRLTAVSEPVYAFLRSHALAARQPQYFGNVLVAALFALHPLRVESVAWIAERKDLLSGLLFMLMPETGSRSTASFVLPRSSAT